MTESSVALIQLHGIDSIQLSLTTDPHIVKFRKKERNYLEEEFPPTQSLPQNLLSIHGLAEGSFSIISLAAESLSFNFFNSSPRFRATETSCERIGGLNGLKLFGKNFVNIVIKRIVITDIMCMALIQ